MEEASQRQYAIVEDHEYRVPDQNYAEQNHYSVVVREPQKFETDQNDSSMTVAAADEEDGDRMEDLTALPPVRKPKNPGKWRGYDAKRIFKKEWLKEYAWLSGDPDDPTHALCKVCGKKIRAHKGDIEKHQKTKRHLKKQTTSDILADLIPISCENLDGTKNSSEIDHNDPRAITNSGPVSDGQQIIYFTESAVDTQQNTNTLIDKLVEKYHQKRIENLKVEHEATLELNKEQLGILKQQLELDANLNENKTTLAKEEHDIRLKFLQREHEAKLKAIEDERDARLRAIEQELLFARQEYEKKMRLLDVQLSSMK